MGSQFERLISLYGHSKLERIFKLHVVVAGLGGVGSYCVCSLVRSGVGSVTIIDYDKIELSNINRQLFATNSTVGKLKVDVAQEHLKDINPHINVYKISEKLDSDNVSLLLNQNKSKIDYCVDCIDDIKAKISLVKFCQSNNIPVISCMGTALKTNPNKLKFDDLYNTKNCHLSKKMRHEARKSKIKNLDVLYSYELPYKPIDKNLGSTSYLPPIAGLMLSSYVIDRI